MNADERRLLVQSIVRWLRHIDRLDEIPGARWPGLQYNPLWDAANAIERKFMGVSGSPDETRRLREGLESIACDSDATALQLQARAARALAGVGEHRPDQPQNKDLGSARSGRADADKERDDCARP